MFIYAGRFQPFHRDHFSTLKTLLDQTPELTLAIVIKKNSFENPFTFFERYQMIYRTLIANELEVKRLYFIPLFAPKVMRWEVNDHLLPQQRTWYVHGGETGRAERYRASGETVITIENSHNINATTVREKIAADDDWENYLPEPVALYLKSINACKRLKFLYDNGIFLNEPVSGITPKMSGSSDGK